MRWFFLAFLLFVAADISLLYLILKHGGVEVLLAVIFGPWLFRAPMVDWARKRADAPVTGNPVSELSRIGDQFLLTLASVGLFLPGVLLRLISLSLLSRALRARLKSFAGRKAARFSPAQAGGVFPGGVVFTQVYAGGSEWPGTSPAARDIETLKRADAREVDGDVPVLPDGPASDGTTRTP